MRTVVTPAYLTALFVTLGLLMTTVQVALVWRLVAGRRLERREPYGEASISILKPMHGVEDGLEENLESFAHLTGIDGEVILSIAGEDDPAVAVARRVMARFPEAPFRLVIGGAPPGRIRNPKVERLVAAARVATGDVFFISDSNVRLEPNDVAETVALLDDSAIGCVSNLFTGDGARNLGARVDALHLLTFVLPGTALADAGGVPCVVGKSMAIPRRVHDAIGGFAAFGNVLAEDQAIGLAVKAAGYRLAVSPVVVRNVIQRRSLAQALSRQVRWGKIRFAFGKATFLGEILINPLGVAMAACFASALAAPAGLGVLAPVLGLTLLHRIASAQILASLAGTRLGFWDLVTLPLKDALQLATQLVPVFSRHVVWHGHKARLGSGTLMQDPETPAPA